MALGQARYEIDWAKFHLFTRTRTLRIMEVTVAECRIVARRKVLFRKYPGFPDVRPIGLANSIYGVVRPVDNKGSYVGRVGSNLSYAMSVENGASPHIIRPRAVSLGGGVYQGGPRRHLFFYWIKIGEYVRFRKVNHPGQEGKHYLRDALLHVGRKRRFRVRLKAGDF